MSSITDLSAYAEKRYQEGYDYANSTDVDFEVALSKDNTFLRGYMQACDEITEKEAERLWDRHGKGWDAYFRGEAKTACPYPPESIDQSNWVNGWDEAKERVGIPGLTPDEVHAFLEGWYAYHNNDPLSACPYPENSTTRHWWINQWKEADSQTEKHVIEDMGMTCEEIEAMIRNEICPICQFESYVIAVDGGFRCESCGNEFMARTGQKTMTLETRP